MHACCVVLCCVFMYLVRVVCSCHLVLYAIHCVLSALYVRHVCVGIPGSYVMLHMFDDRVYVCPHVCCVSCHPWCQDSSGMSLCMLAAAGGQNDILRLLIRKGVRVNGRQNTGTTALMHAAEKVTLEPVLTTRVQPVLTTYNQY